MTDAERIAELEATASAHTEWAVEMIADKAKLRGELKESQRFHRELLDLCFRQREEIGALKALLGRSAA